VEADQVKVLFIAAEAVPFAKTGGLADVAGSLPTALQEKNVHVRLAMPMYRGIEGTDYVCDFPVRMNRAVKTAVVKKRRLKKGVGVYFISNYSYFDRDELYGYQDDPERFIFFCKSVLEMIKRLGWKPDIIHCHDWHTGLVPVYMKTILAADPFYTGVKTVFTIHNLQYQGICSAGYMRTAGLNWDLFTSDNLEFYGKLNMIKGGIVFSDIITTVSERYAKEIQTPVYGVGLAGVLRSRRNNLFGIINGLDYSEWNPQKDRKIPARYSWNSYEKKAGNTAGLRQLFGLPESDCPVVGMVTRLVEQKGLDLLRSSMRELMKRDLQMVILGSGEPQHEAFLTAAARTYPSKLAVYIGYSDDLARLIYAGSDMFFMPSRFEPGGLGQLISMRYGSVPVVRSCGGLAETVHNFNPHDGSGNGFSFADYSPAALVDAFDRALAVYYQNREFWQVIATRGMQEDHSWRRSAEDYVTLYERLVPPAEEEMQGA